MASRPGMRWLLSCTVFVQVVRGQSGVGSFIVAGLGGNVTATSSTSTSVTITSTPSSDLTSSTAFTDVTSQVTTSAPYSNGTVTAPSSINTTNAMTTAPPGDACYFSSQAWLSASSAYANNTALWSTWVTTITEYSDNFGPYFKHFDNNFTTTLCDNILRPMGSVEFIPGARFGSFVTSMTTSGLNYTVPPPSCTIAPDECASLVNAYSTYASLTWNSLYASGLTVTAAPDCDYSAASTCPGDCVLDAYGGVAQLFYWPEEDVPSINCNATLESLPNAGATVESDYWTVVNGQKRDVGIYPNITAAPAAPRVWSSGDITITSPSLAMYFQSLSRGDGCGPTLDSYVVTMDASQASTIRGYNAYFDYYPLHLQDLNTECVEGQGCFAKVSLDAYVGQRTCADDLGIFSHCFTIWNDYNPALMVPTQVSLATSLAPQWGSSCVPRNVWGAWDPPKALSEQAEAGVSVPVQATTTSSLDPMTTSASPASIPETPATATTTPSAVPDTDPSASNQGSQPQASTSASPNPAPADPDDGSSATDDDAGTASNEQTTSADVGALISLINSEASASTASAAAAAAGGTVQPGSDSDSGSDSGSGSGSSPGSGSAGQSVDDPSQVPSTQASNTDPQQTSGNTDSTSGDRSSYAGSAVVISAGSQAITAIPGSGVVVGAATLSAGDPATTLSNGQIVSAAANGVVVDGTTHAVTTPASGTPVAVAIAGSQIITAASGSSLVLAGTTLSAGGVAATLSDGHVVSLAAEGLVVDGTTAGYNADPASAGLSTGTPVAVAVAGSQTITVISGSDLVVAGTTLSAGGAAATLTNGHIVSVATNGLVIDGTTAEYAVDAASAGVAGPSAAVVTVGGQVFTAQETDGSIILGTNTLSQGQVTTVYGVAVSAGSSGIVVAGSTIPFSHGSAQDPYAATSAAVVTIGSQVYTAEASDGSVVIGTHTLSDGQATTIDGVAISDASSILIVGGQTLALSQVASQSLGAPIATITAGSDVFTAIEASGTSGDIILEEGQTLQPGESAFTADGETFSVGSNGLVVASGTRKSTVPLEATTNIASSSTAGSQSSGGPPPKSTKSVAASGRAGFGSFSVILMCGLLAAVAML